MNNSFSKVAVWMVIALVLFTVFKQFDSRAPSQDSVSYTQFMDDAKAGKVRALVLASDSRSPLIPDVPTFEQAIAACTTECADSNDGGHAALVDAEAGDRVNVVRGI